MVVRGVSCRSQFDDRWDELRDDLIHSGLVGGVGELVDEWGGYGRQMSWGLPEFVLVVFERAAEGAHSCKPEGLSVFVTALDALEYLNSVLNYVIGISGNDGLKKLALNGYRTGYR